MKKGCLSGEKSSVNSVKRRTGLLVILLTVFLFSAAGCGGKADEEELSQPGGASVGAAEINVSAAASLTQTLEEIKTEYVKGNDTGINFNFGGSGALQKQIEEGAPCDLFLSASKANMDALEEAGLLVDGSRKDLLGNSLVLIASAEKGAVVNGYESLADPAVESIAIGTPETVPAGNYARQALQNLSVWDRIQDKIVYAKDVRQVLEYVDSGNSDCGLVYKTDALIMKTGIVVMEMPESSHDPIVYPAALIKDSAQKEAAAEFYEYLQSDYSKTVFEKYGFTVYE